MFCDVMGGLSNHRHEAEGYLSGDIFWFDKNAWESRCFSALRLEKKIVGQTLRLYLNKSTGRNQNCC
jgi:CDP-diacylglycerol pyrophosphatase